MIRTVATALVLLFSSVSFAGDMNKKELTLGEQAQQDFIVLDQDGNGLLNETEVNANSKVAGTFVDIDLNDNNEIDMDEFLIYRSEATAAGKPEKMDVDKIVK